MTQKISVCFLKLIAKFYGVLILVLVFSGWYFSDFIVEKWLSNTSLSSELLTQCIVMMFVIIALRVINFANESNISRVFKS